MRAAGRLRTQPDVLFRCSSWLEGPGSECKTDPVGSLRLRIGQCGFNCHVTLRLITSHFKNQAITRIFCVFLFKFFKFSHFVPSHTSGQPLVCRRNRSSVWIASVRCEVCFVTVFARCSVSSPLQLTFPLPPWSVKKQHRDEKMQRLRGS